MLASSSRLRLGVGLAHTVRAPPCQQGCNRALTLHCRSRRFFANASAKDSETRFGWDVAEKEPATGSTELPLAVIRRPLQRTRSNNQEKVQALMESISERGLMEPIDVLEVDGKYYGFSGCHRFEAFQRLEKETIPCRVRKATEKTLRQHLM
mmetsp:Transcript_21290/g.64057  ORF Transcript_21290/g.64057 Transcript_21290/m.64057 type:complete len:152 (+) Transcript_21290:100-555(+)